MFSDPSEGPLSHSAFSTFFIHCLFGVFLSLHVDPVFIQSKGCLTGSVQVVPLMHHVGVCVRKMVFVGNHFDVFVEKRSLKSPQENEAPD